MRIDDFLNLKTGPEALVRLALYPFLILIVGSLAMTIVGQLSNAGFALAVIFLVLLSPVAYLMRENRQRRRQRHRPRRGAERTPLVPPEEEA